MEMLVIGAIAAGLFFLYWKGPTLLTQHVFDRGGHKRGKQLVSEQTTFHSHAPRREVSQAIVQGVSAETEAPWLLPKVYLVHASEQSITFSCGNRLMSAFVVRVALDHHDGGTRGTYAVTDWMTSNGVVARQKELTKLKSDIDSAVKRMSPKPLARAS